MADTSLDDFFAKKDKSKKKNKSKFTPSDLMAKQKEEPKKVEEKVREEKPQQNDKPVEKTLSEMRKEQDEQWVDFDEEKDYSGLRIQNMQIAEDEQGGEENEKGEDKEEGGEANEGPTGPWMIVQPTPKPAEPAPAPVEAAQPAKSEPTQPGKYLPPSLRNQQSNPAPLRKGRKKVAPNLTSEEDFPSLGGHTPDISLDDGTGARFEKVRSGGRQVGESQMGVKLELGNKFDALGTD